MRKYCLLLPFILVFATEYVVLVFAVNEKRCDIVLNFSYFIIRIALFGCDWPLRSGNMINNCIQVSNLCKYTTFFDKVSTNKQLQQLKCTNITSITCKTTPNWTKLIQKSPKHDWFVFADLASDWNWCWCWFVLFLSIWKIGRSWSNRSLRDQEITQGWKTRKLLKCALWVAWNSNFVGTKLFFCEPKSKRVRAIAKIAHLPYFFNNSRIQLCCEVLNFCKRS